MPKINGLHTADKPTLKTALLFLFKAVTASVAKSCDIHWMGFPVLSGLTSFLLSRGLSFRTKQEVVPASNRSPSFCHVTAGMCSLHERDWKGVSQFDQKREVKWW